MKKALLCLFLAFVSISFGQVSQNVISKSENPSNGLLYAKKSLYSLNFSSFELYGSSANGSELVSKLSDGIDARGLRYPCNFPVFMRGGDAIRKINSFDTKPKDESDIYDAIEPRYYLRTIG